MIDSNITRPNPDILLHELNESETLSRKGKLKIFFGMCAGVGKTYTMLEASNRLKAEGRDVRIGYIETHGRKETDALVRDLPVIPRLKIDYRGISVEDMDLDAVITAHPEIVLVDELAHTNTKGMRHTKRYQDVMEILDQGIDVYTTLNIQHLDSQIDSVEKIIGVKIRETLPDTVLERADEVELVDLVPEELLTRLADGKVYRADRADAAAHNFFRRENITALREMSLRYVAKLVDHQLLAYVRKKNLTGSYQTGEKLLVAVGPSPYSEYLIRWTRKTAFNLKAPWMALYIEGPLKLKENAKKILARNLSLARELGAEVMWTVDDSIANGLVRTARQKQVTQIVVGKPLRKKLSDYFKRGNLIDDILHQSGDIELHIVTQPDVPKQKGFHPGNFRFTSRFYEYIAALVSVALLTGVNSYLDHYTGYWTIAILYLFLVSIISFFIGRGPVFLVAGLSAFTWNFFFIPPKYTLRIGNEEDILMFITFFMLAFILGNSTTRLRSKETALRAREKRLVSLYDFTRSIAHSIGIDEIVSTVIEYVEANFNSQAAIILIDGSDHLKTSAHGASTFEITHKEYGVAVWAFNNRKPAGKYTDTLPESEAYHIPILLKENAVGVLSIRPKNDDLLTLEQSDFLQHVCYQLSSSLKRELLSESIRHSEVNMESERIYNVLLNSVSHELRTPLTTIKGAATGLLDETINSNESARTQLTVEIMKASDRLSRLVDNLLDINRLESGRFKLIFEEHDLNDLFSVVLRRLNADLEGHDVKINIASDLPLVRFDFTLLEQAIVNIIFNATTHAGADCVMEINVFAKKDKIQIIISDNGPGINEADQPYIFDKFRRGVNAATGGTGLGLSISRGIVEAHGGTIEVKNRSPHGAEFTIAIPINTIRGKT